MMVFLGPCIPCQYGDHDRHYEVTQAVPEGVIGGGRCPCKGECVERNRGKIEADAARLAALYAERAVPEREPTKEATREEELTTATVKRAWRAFSASMTDDGTARRATYSELVAMRAALLAVASRSVPCEPTEEGT